jgi:hypothetical protein
MDNVHMKILSPAAVKGCRYTSVTCHHTPSRMDKMKSDNIKFSQGCGGLEAFFQA